MSSGTVLPFALFFAAAQGSQVPVAGREQPDGGNNYNQRKDALLLPAGIIEKVTEKVFHDSLD